MLRLHLLAHHTDFLGMSVLGSEKRKKEMMVYYWSYQVVI
jgi:hypothetical protein